MNPTIADVARDIADEHGMGYDEALTLATTYAIQLGENCGVQEGGQAPNRIISGEVAGLIIAAARAAADN